MRYFNKHTISIFSVLSTAVISSAQDTGSVLDFTGHARMTMGSQKGNPTHGHDPDEEITLQGVELGMSLRANEFLEGFINTNVFLSNDDKIDSEWEEGFLKLKNIPALGGTFELRAGRYLNRLGSQNNTHLHGWKFIDANLSTGLFLGEESLKTEGLELSWGRDYSNGSFIISGSYGNALEHSHDDHDDDHDEEHDDEHDPIEETRENSYFNGKLFTVRAQASYNADDYNYHTLGLNYAQGENGYGRDSELFSIDYAYKWRENGIEAGGKEWQVGLEYINRSVEWVDEDSPSIQGSSSQQSAMAEAGYTFKENWNVAARYGWIEGVNDSSFVTNERKRLSLALTHHYDLNDYISGHARLQYNHDDLDNGNSEDGVWLQVGFDFGKGEVR